MKGRTRRKNLFLRIYEFNKLGQKVYDLAVDANRATMNMRQLEAGVYFMHVETENGSNTQRVVLKE